jgi:hypothetical protein
VSAPFRNHTPRSDWPTHGRRLAKVAAAKGRPFMPWQRLAADVSHEYDPATGFYRYSVIVVTVPRQSGKTDLEGSAADARCLWLPNQRVRITMQDGKTADEWMREQHFESLAASVFAGRYVPSKRAGMHGVLWPHTRSTFNTFAPIRTALHSKQTDVGFVDEAWAHGSQAGKDIKQALGPTMASRDRFPPGPQTWVVSTLGDETSTYLDEYVARGVASLGDPLTKVCFIDYGIPEDADPEDLDVIAAHHPAVGHTITRRTLELERENFRDVDTGIIDVAGYARAYGNRGSKVREYVFPGSVWSDAGAPRQPVPDRAGLGLDVAPDGRTYAIGAGWHVGNTGYVEVLAAGDVTRDLPEKAAAIARARGVPLVVARHAAAALEVTDGFARLPERDRPEVTFLNAASAGSACVTFSRGIFRGDLHHANDDALDDAVGVAGKKNLLEGGFRWVLAGPGSITALNAVTWALRGYELLPAPLARPVAYA